jgi:hypothetical protein
LSSDSDVHCLFTVELVVAAFNLAAVVSDHKNVEHQNLDFFSGFRQSPVAMEGLDLVNGREWAAVGSYSPSRCDDDQLSLSMIPDVTRATSQMHEASHEWLASRGDRTFPITHHPCRQADDPVYPSRQCYKRVCTSSMYFKHVLQTT